MEEMYPYEEVKPEKVNLKFISDHGCKVVSNGEDAVAIDTDGGCLVLIPNVSVDEHFPNVDGDEGEEHF